MQTDGCMLFTVAEKLMLAADTYPCQWSYREKGISGEIQLERSRTPAGEMFDAPGTWVEGEGHRSFQPHEDTADILRGRFRSGYEMVLLDVGIQHLLPERSWVHGRMALAGATVPRTLVFDSARFQVGGLTELAGVYPVKNAPPALLGSGAVIGATWDAELSTQSWTTSGGDNLEFDFNATMDHDRGYGFELSSAPVITVSGNPRSAEDWMRQYVRPLAEITTLATLRPQPVSWVTLYHTEKNSLAQLIPDWVPDREVVHLPVQVFAADIAQQPYDAASTDASHLISQNSGTLIRLGPDGATLPDLLAGWQSLQDTYITFFDYLTTALRASMNPKSRFLALVPALEGFHLARHGDGPIPAKDFKKQRTDVLRRIRDLDGVDQDDVEFLKKWLGVYGSYQLADRLRVIVNQELGEGLRERIRARTDPIPGSLVGLIDRPDDVWAIMGTARNRIAHGLDNQPSSAQLTALTRLAHTVAIGASLNLLGVPDTVLCAAIDDGRWPMT
jgi:ApeA N-terminal domain 1